MTQATLGEYAAALRGRYFAAGKKEKGRILDEFCRTSGLHRKAAIRLLRGRQRCSGPARGKKGRPIRYGAEVMEPLRKVWEMSDRLSGKLLVAVIKNLVDSLERHGELRLGPGLWEALCSMSAATIDRRLRGWRRGLGRQPRRQAQVTTGLKAEIPIRTWSEWQDVRPGSAQADLVLHCGESTEGFYLTTLTMVDVATGWTERWPAWGTAMLRVRQAVQRAGRLHNVARDELAQHAAPRGRLEGAAVAVEQLQPGRQAARHSIEGALRDQEHRPALPVPQRLQLLFLRPMAQLDLVERAQLLDARVQSGRAVFDDDPQLRRSRVGKEAAIDEHDGDGEPEADVSHGRGR